MRIITRTASYGLEVTIKSGNTVITEDIYSVDETLKQDVLILIEDMYDVEEDGLDEVLKYFWDRADSGEKEKFIDFIENNERL